MLPGEEWLHASDPSATYLLCKGYLFKLCFLPAAAAAAAAVPDFSCVLAPNRHSRTWHQRTTQHHRSASSVPNHHPSLVQLSSISINYHPWIVFFFTAVTYRINHYYHYRKILLRIVLVEVLNNNIRGWKRLPTAARSSSKNQT